MANASMPVAATARLMNFRRVYQLMREFSLPEGASFRRGEKAGHKSNPFGIALLRVWNTGCGAKTITCERTLIVIFNIK